MTGWRSNLVFLNLSDVIFLTKVAYDNEILRQKKNEQFLLFIIVSVLNDDVVFEDWGCDFERVNCDISESLLMWAYNSVFMMGRWYGKTEVMRVKKSENPKRKMPILFLLRERTREFIGTKNYMWM